MNDQAIEALTALVNTLTDQQKGLQGNIDALNEAIKALQEGGVVAQTAIDQAVSDKVSVVLTSVQEALSTNVKTPSGVIEPLVL
jgi:outer membrane murein-binding lipoprotein Lpp